MAHKFFVCYVPGIMDRLKDLLKFLKDMTHKTVLITYQITFVRQRPFGSKVYNFLLGKFVRIVPIFPQKKNIKSVASAEQGQVPLLK